ncbi:MULTISPECIES: MerR family transcriptional regulator [Acidovorax]|uniref:MerR family transcriptional regulator n=1 Tax=Acidovorax TaxID=12916 RepID=UPI0002377162|nr:MULTISPECIES: MerR family transcriptional regulator [Acidovorax]KRD25507.1 MerR family transcriptional regulator [Acidovorax sp. Root267]KRD56092.1 MerR family transcriptional regulator [Acidovorax sp. Root275]MBD9393883.1 MerR family transcriptional regulator [Acidovorax sp. ACV01]
MGTPLPSIPAKRYFTIGEVAELCGVKPHVLRYWEQEFTQLRPMKRRGNRRYYQHHEVLMIRRIRDLLYDQGFTISGARNRLQELAHPARDDVGPDAPLDGLDSEMPSMLVDSARDLSIEATGFTLDSNAVRKELFEIRALLSLN